MSETARYLDRQADLLEEQGHDVSAQVCRDAAKELYAAKARLAALLEPGEYGDLPSRLLADAALCDVSKDEDAQGLRETMQLEIVAAAAIEQLQAQKREAEARLAVHEAERAAAPALIEELEALREMAAATYSHVDGRDLLAEMRPHTWHFCDIRVRVTGQWKEYEGDWLKRVWMARSRVEAIRGR